MKDVYVFLKSDSDFPKVTAIEKIAVTSFSLHHKDLQN
jgi:hypothetical protein